MRVIVRKPRGTATTSKTKASALAVCFLKKAEADKHWIEFAILNLMENEYLPSVVVALWPQVPLVVETTEAAEYEPLVRERIERNVCLLRVSHY